MADYVGNRYLGARPTAAFQPRSAPRNTDVWGNPAGGVWGGLGDTSRPGADMTGGPDESSPQPGVDPATLRVQNPGGLPGIIQNNQQGLNGVGDTRLLAPTAEQVAAGGFVPGSSFDPARQLSATMNINPNAANQGGPSTGAPAGYGLGYPAGPGNVSTLQPVTGPPAGAMPTYDPNVFMLPNGSSWFNNPVNNASSADYDRWRINTFFNGSTAAGNNPNRSFYASGPQMLPD